MSTPDYSIPNNNRDGGYGMSFLTLCGAVFAGVISWQTNKSLIWLALHVLCGHGGEWV